MRPGRFSATRAGSARIKAHVDQLLPVEVADLLLPEIALKRRERGGLAPQGRFPYLAHIGYMKVDEVAKGLEAGDGRLVRRQPLIGPGLRLAGPAMGVVAASGRLARVAALSSDPDPGWHRKEVRVDGSLFRALAHLCNESSRRGEFVDIGAYASVAAVATNCLKIYKKCK